MKKSTRALVGTLVLDALLAAGAAWFVMDIKRGAALTVPPAEAITTVATIAGGAIGIVTGILLVAFFVHRRFAGITNPPSLGCAVVLHAGRQVNLICTLG